MEWDYPSEDGGGVAGKCPGVFGKVVVGQWYLRKLAGSVLVVRVGYAQQMPRVVRKGPKFRFRAGCL